MTIPDILRAMWRWWWIVIGLPIVVLILAFVLTPAPPYVSTVKATVLIPGDTEDTGSAERPELMILDDLGPFIGSRAFALFVAAKLTPDQAKTIPVADVQSALSGTRYSRVATITVSTDSSSKTAAIASAAALAFPDAVNTYLVAPGADQAKVQVIDPPGDPAQSQRKRILQIAIETIVAGFAGVGIAVLIQTIRPYLPKRQAGSSPSK
jgi:uncharacterized protein involved in exopolysaccharide biosynthesis